MILGLLSAMSSLYSGYSTQQSKNDQASMMEKQGLIAYQESLRDAADLRDEGKRTKNEQMMAFIGSGVEIQGTPLLLMKETEIRSEYEAFRVEERGKAQFSYYQNSAKIARREGRSAMISSMINAPLNFMQTEAKANGG